MAATASAGTLISAVLETAGFLAQSDILQNFQNFFHSVGYFLYILAAIGALTSFAVFGSYRMGLYLLLGPAIFFVMLYPAPQGAQPLGAVWRIGGGQPRNQVGREVSETEAITSVRNIIVEDQQVTGQSGNALRPNIAVAWPFAVVTGLIDEVVKIFVDVLLKYEDDKDLLFMSKIQAFDQLLNSGVEDQELIGMFQGDFLVQCNDMFAAAVEQSSPKLSTIRERELNDEIARQTDPNVVRYYQGELNTLLASRAKAASDYQLASTSHRASPGPIMRRYMSETLTQPNSAARNALLRSEPGLAPDPRRDGAITCGDMWQIIEEALWAHADVIQQKLTDKYAAMLPAADKGLLCVEISRKLGRDLSDADAPTCSLVEAAGAYLLRNAIQSRGRSIAAQRVRNSIQGIETIKKGTLVPLDVDKEVEDYVLVGGRGGYQSRINQVSARDPNSKRREALFLRNSLGTYEWHPVAGMDEVAGTVDAAFVEHQRYQARELRQKIFTFALHLPYWQGVLLFLISISYPFMAVLLVLPGRASGFLYVPLAWLWVKSWDVGFAAVMVFDKVVWNMFPSVDFDDNFFLGRSLGGQALPVMLREAFKVDPAFNVHAYYFFVSMALVAVPTLTGYLILRAKQSMLDSFTDPMEQAAESAGMRAGQVYGGVLNDVNAQRMNEKTGLNFLAVTNRGQGFEGDGRGQVADMFGKLSAVSKAAKTGGAAFAQLNSIAGLANRGAVAQRMFLPDYSKTYGEVLGAEARAKAAYNSVFHPLFGRVGRIQMMSEAMMAATDADRGYEMNFLDQVTEGVRAQTELAEMKLKLTREMMTDSIMGGTQGLGLIPGLPTAASIFAAFPSADVLMSYLRTYAGDAPDNRNRLQERLYQIFQDPLTRDKIEVEFDRFSYFLASEFGFSPDDVGRLFSIAPRDRRGEGLQSAPTRMNAPLDRSVKQRPEKGGTP